MSKKKLLIYYPESMLKPVGGPAGYLFNLRQGLDTLNKEEFPIDVSFYEAAPKSLRDTVKNKDKIPKRLREFRRAVDDIFYEKKAYPLDEKLHQYDMIHFHSIDAMYLCRKTLENYKGTVILTSHSPCAKFKEKLAWLNPFDYKMLKKWVDRIEEMDAYSDELSELGYDQESHVLYSKSECRPWLSLFCRIAIGYFIERMIYGNITEII